MRAVFSIVLTASLALWSVPATAQQAPRASIEVDELVDALAPPAKASHSGIRLRGLPSVGLRGATIKPPSIDLKIEFDYDSAKLTPQARALLATVAKALRTKRLDTLGFEVVGHTDAAGSDDYNLSLSERRAVAVVDFLVMRERIDPKRLYASGRGESQLLFPGAPEDGRNRRVEFKTRF